MVTAFVGRKLGIAVNRKRVLRVMRERKLIQRRRPIERLAADAGDARHHRRRVPLGDQVTRAGDALSHSHSRKSFPAISSS